MARKPSISLIGAGNLAHALAVALRRAGYPIDQIVVRPGSLRRAQRLARQVKARAVVDARARVAADIIWFCVNDDGISASAQQYASQSEWKGKIALHSSGALPSDELRALKRQGAAIASVHPMMTFVAGTPASMKDVAFALEGDAAAVRAARRIAADMGGHPFLIRKENKALYHAVGGFCSPLIIALLAAGELVAKQAKVPPAEMGRVMKPILQRTIENYVTNGAAASFSGPIKRGDVETIRKHLAALKKVPQARAVYVALVKVALEALPVGNKRQLEKNLRLTI